MAINIEITAMNNNSCLNDACLYRIHSKTNHISQQRRIIIVFHAGFHNYESNPPISTSGVGRPVFRPQFLLFPICDIVFLSHSLERFIPFLTSSEEKNDN